MSVVVCARFEPNVFRPTLCAGCQRGRNEHEAAAFDRAADVHAAAAEAKPHESAAGGLVPTGCTTFEPNPFKDDLCVHCQRARRCHVVAASSESEVGDLAKSTCEMLAAPNAVPATAAPDDAAPVPPPLADALDALADKVRRFFVLRFAGAAVAVAAADADAPVVAVSPRRARRVPQALGPLASFRRWLAARV